MELIMDMVHDNPGEERTETIFRNPEVLIEYGYNTQVFKHFNTIATFEKLGYDFFPSAQSKVWLNKMTEIIEKELYSAKKSGLMVMSHIDLFVLPEALVEKYKSEICDSDGKISIHREKTKQIHRIMFDELFSKYPVDGLIIRVGETYLHDTPYHTGNGAVKYGNISREKDSFVELISFLVEEVCKKHKKYLIFRTWDCYLDRFHGNLQYYLDVTNKVEPCEKLIFSIKHTALDFWRRVKFNPCLCQGKHRQIVEVQCQREYEGKGAYPTYIMNGVINGFPENKKRIGLKDIAEHPLICGVYTWSRGGGWFGPYLKNEFWCKLNTYIISNYANDTRRCEKEIFLEFAMKKMGMDTENANKFYDLCIEVSDAVLHSRYIEAYDNSLNEEKPPCINWMRDDSIGGLRQLNKVFDYLEQNDLVEDALSEKEKAISIWKAIRERFEEIEISDGILREFISNSIEYALRLFSIVNISFKIFAEYRKGKSCEELLKKYDMAWEEYRELESRPQSSSSYKDSYYFAENCLGLNETIALCRNEDK